MILLKLAWRNLWRNRRRTILTASTLALGLVVLLVFVGLGDGAHQQMIDSAVRMGSGHIIFQARGYQELGGVERTLSGEQQAAVQSWIEALPAHYRVDQVAPRVFASVLGSSADGSSGVQLVAGRPDVEKHSRLAESLSEGEFLGDEEGRALIGKGVARKLELELEDKLVLMGQGVAEGMIESILVRVEGILETGLQDLDQALVVSDLKTAQEFLQLDDQVHQIAVLLENEARSEELALEAAAAFPDLEVLHWKEALPELADFIRIDDGGNYVFHLFLFLLIAFMVLNTLLMSVLERAREFTLLEALGLSGGQRFSLIILESSLIALLATLAGLAIGLSLHGYLTVYGLRLDSFMNVEDANVAGVAFDPIMYSYLSLARILQAVGVVFGMNLVLALFVARRASHPGDIRLLGSH